MKKNNDTDYRPRIIDETISMMLQTSGGILIEGCKWCGKTTTAKQHARSLVEFQDPDRQDEYKGIANTKPSLFLEGEKPRLFDEWQRYPVVWDSIRMDVDRTRLMGQYILTGSAKPADDAVMHTGTGRISRVVMRTMSLYESGFSDGKVSLKDVADGKEISATNKMRLEDLANYAVWGGWPVVPSLNDLLRPQLAKNYVNSVIHEEVQTLDETERNYDKMRAVLKSLSRNVSTPVSISTIEQDTKNQFNTGVSRVTVSDYMNVLQKLFVVYDIPATTLSFRSKAAIRTTPKRELVDPSIAVAALDMTAENLVRDLRTFGFIFECMAMRDLMVYSGYMGENIQYYRNADGFEVDAIVNLDDGKWGAVEVKLGTGQIEEAAQNLLKFRELVTKPSTQPDFLMVLTGGNYSYKREDGVYVISIGSLKN